MNGKPELTKEPVASAVTDMKGLLKERAEIGKRMDALIDEIGDAYRRLTEVNGKIGKVLFYTAGSAVVAPPWLADRWTGEVLRNRLAMEIAPHSAGGANESSVGPVSDRMSLMALFKKNNEGIIVP